VLGGVLVGVTVLVGVIVCVGTGLPPGVLVGVTVGVGEQKSMSSILLALALSTSSTDLILLHKTSLTLLTVGILNKLY
jgi:hypothetical protein